MSNENTSSSSESLHITHCKHLSTADCSPHLPSLLSVCLLIKRCSHKSTLNRRVRIAAQRIIAVVTETRSPLCHLPSLLIANTNTVQRVSNKQILLLHYERTFTCILKLDSKPPPHRCSDRLERFLHLAIHMSRFLQKDLVKGLQETKKCSSNLQTLDYKVRPVHALLAAISLYRLAHLPFLSLR